MRWALTILVVLLATLSPGSVRAQFRDETRIRRSTKSILDSSEFRHLRGRLVDVPRPGDSQPGDGGGGGGRNGNGQGGANGGGAGGDAGRDQGGAGRPERRVTRVREGEGGGNGGGGSSSSFGGGGGGGSVGQFFAVLAWVLVAVVCGLILFYVLRAIVDAARGKDAPLTGDDAPTTALEGEVEAISAPGDLAADVYVRRARQLAAAGRIREAVAHLLLGAMSYVEQQGLIRFRRGLTFRSYLSALSGKQRPRQAFRSLVGVYEPIEYGRREATRAHFEAALAMYEDGFAV